MKKNLIIGIDENTDIDILLSDGIKQFYFGYIPQSYIQTYATQTSLNRRYRLKEQFQDLERIYTIIDKIHQHNGIIYLALNAFTSNEIMLEYSNELYELFREKVDGINVANIAIASMLQQKNYSKIVLSNLFGSYTTSAVEFLINCFDPIKIILPRDISLENIKTIVSSFPNTNFECFLYGDNCRYSESFCFTEHGYDSVGFGSLCSYAQDTKILLKSATPTYKQIVKNSKLTDKEKKEHLQKEVISIDTLLENIELYSFEFDSVKISENLEILGMYDTKMFYKEKKTYIKAINTLQNVKFPKAKEIVKKLQTNKYEDEDRYKVFHNLNKSAIFQTIDFFQQYKNITSYKIPSRGRDFYKYLDTNIDEPYNYKQSQYKL